MHFPSSLKVFTLNNGIKIPVIGLGVYQMADGDRTQHAIDRALKVGYRHIDTAAIYHNEISVGKAVRSSLIPREQIFITTKLWNADQGYDQAIRAFEKSLSNLGMDWVDLYLIHWPVQGKRKDSWRALEKLYNEGRCKAIGVSNYMENHMEELLSYANVKPAVNQIELHPYLLNERMDIVNLCRQADIIPIAYSPLTRGTQLKDPSLVKIAKSYEKTTAQLLIRWGVQQGFAVIPKSAIHSRIEENIDVFDFEISAADMERLNELGQGYVTGWNPAGVP
jgi:diketogulonate reductase-like aldo/keto reductase